MPRRLTYHPGADEVVGWTPDGKRVLFSSHRDSYADSGALYTLPVEGGFPTELPLSMAEDGSYSLLTVRTLLMCRCPAVAAAWKRYRGGQTTKIWIANLADSTPCEIPRENSNDFNPMWVGNKIYFLSDRNGPVSLWTYDTASEKVAEVVKNDGLDFKSASAGPGAIVYEQFGSIYLFDLKSGKSKHV